MLKFTLCLDFEIRIWTVATTRMPPAQESQFGTWTSQWKQQRYRTVSRWKKTNKKKKKGKQGLKGNNVIAHKVGLQKHAPSFLLFQKLCNKMQNYAKDDEIIDLLKIKMSDTPNPTPEVRCFSTDLEAWFAGRTWVRRTHPQHKRCCFHPTIECDPFCKRQTFCEENVPALDRKWTFWIKKGNVPIFCKKNGQFSHFPLREKLGQARIYLIVSAEGKLSCSFPARGTSTGTSELPRDRGSREKYHERKAKHLRPELLTCGIWQLDWSKNLKNITLSKWCAEFRLTQRRNLFVILSLQTGISFWLYDGFNGTLGDAFRNYNLLIGDVKNKTTTVTVPMGRSKQTTKIRWKSTGLISKRHFG